MSTNRNRRSSYTFKKPMKKTRATAKRISKKAKTRLGRDLKLDAPSWFSLTDKHLSKMQAEVDRMPTTFQIAQLAAQFITEPDFDEESRSQGENRVKTAASNAMTLYFTCRNEMADQCSEWRNSLMKSRLEIEYRKRFLTTKTSKNWGNLNHFR